MAKETYNKVWTLEQGEGAHLMAKRVKVFKGRGTKVHHVAVNMEAAKKWCDTQTVD